MNIPPDLMLIPLMLLTPEDTKSEICKILYLLVCSYTKNTNPPYTLI